MADSELKLDKWFKQVSNCVSLVLNDSGANLFKSANYVCKTICCSDLDPLYFACCLHDKDVNDELQRIETPHYQCILVLKNRLSFKNICKILTNIFKCNLNQIGLEKASDIGAMSRYVCHHGFYGKHEYSLNEVVTNDFDTFMNYYNTIEIKNQVDCVNVVKSYGYSIESIIRHVSNYKQWRTLIKDLIQDFHYSKRL